MGPTIFVTGADDLKASSGSAHYFARSLKDELDPDTAVEPITIHTYRRLYAATLAWGLRERVDPRKYFFMAREFQEANFEANEIAGAGADTLISFSPITPRRERYLRGFDRVFILTDMTHAEYLSYGQFRDIPARIRTKLIDHETESYREADRIFTYNEVAAEQLTGLYGVPEGKVEIVGRGVNLPAEAAARARAAIAAEPHQDGGLTIGFVGVDVERKGLFDLIAAIDALPAGSREKVQVVTIGPDAEQLPDRPFIRSLGFLDKATDLDLICRTMAACDLGYLFSKAEGIPGSVLEFLSLGVPCLVSDIPAMRALDRFPGIVTVPLAEGADGVRRVLDELMGDPPALTAMRGRVADFALNGWSEQAAAVAKWC